MKIKTDEITSVIKQEIQNFASQLEISEVGQVVEVGDGIARANHTFALNILRSPPRKQKLPFSRASRNRLGVGGSVFSLMV